MGDVIGAEAGGIVAAHLVHARAERCRAVVIADDYIRVCGKPAFEIRADGSHEDEEQVFRGGMDAHLCRHADEQRTDIQCGSALVGGYVFLIETYNLAHHPLEKLGRNFGHHYAAACALQSRGVLVHTEHTYLAIGTAVCFQSLERLLTVVQACGGHVHVDVFVGANLHFAPFAVTIVASNVVICRHIAERKVGPI